MLYHDLGPIMMREVSSQAMVMRLRRSALLAPLGEAALRQLVEASRRRELRRGETLWRLGERPDALAMVLRGRLEIVRETASGDRLLLRLLGPHELVGLSTLGGAPHSADLVAGEDSAVLVIPGSALREVLRSSPELALRALAHLGGLLSQLTDELEELRFLDLDGRLLRVLQRRARSLRELRVTHEELAQQVGATRENVSRALKRLERRGALICPRGRLEILDLARGL